MAIVYLLAVFHFVGAGVGALVVPRVLPCGVSAGSVCEIHCRHVASRRYDAFGTWTTNGRVPRKDSSLEMVASATPTNLDGVTSVGEGGQLIGEAARYRLLDVEEASKSWRSLPEMWDFLERECGGSTAVIDPIHPPFDKEARGKQSRKSVGTRLTYGEMRVSIDAMASALMLLGVHPEDCVSIFAENSSRWLITEQGIMRAGACNAVRGASAPAAELRYIYRDSESVGAVVETVKLLKSLLDEGGQGGQAAGQGQGLTSEDGKLPRFLMILFPEGQTGAEIQSSLGIPESIKVVTFGECLSASGDAPSSSSSTPAAAPRMDRTMKATLLYTSGTTGYPKGVILTHANLLHQMIENAFDRSEGQPLNPWVGDVFVSILPCWHIFERTAEYFTLARGVTMVYSNVRNFKGDLKKYQPHFLIVVPRLLETIWQGVQNQLATKSKGAQKAARILTRSSASRMRAARMFRGKVIRDRTPPAIQRVLSAAVMGLTIPLKLAADKLVWSKIREGVGGRVKVVVCGGSSLPSFLEDFYEMAGISILVGYGLTETSPVLTNRITGDNVRGTVGKPAPGTEVKVVDQETGEKVTLGSVGIILARGPQIMRGYQNNPEATEKAIDPEGFLDTGDLGRFNPVTGDLIVTGRAKDTIVLSNGENVEPQPLEDMISGECPLINQVMLVGQDQRFLGAVATLNPLALGTAGIISQDDANRYADLLGPTPLTTGPAASPSDLEQAEKELLATPGLKEAVFEQLKVCSSSSEWRPWEQVGNVILKLEPFSTSNGLITQTLKTKRNVVAERFKDEIDALYSTRR